MSTSATTGSCILAEPDIAEVLERYHHGEIMTNRELIRLSNWIAGIMPKIGSGPSAQMLEKEYWKINEELKARARDK